jgi:hypothetical protein
MRDDRPFAVRASTGSRSNRAIEPTQSSETRTVTAGASVSSRRTGGTAP